MTTKERDQKFKSLLERLMVETTVQDIEKGDPKLKLVFQSSVLSYRELLLLIILTKIIFNDYKPTTELYKYKPRAVINPINEILSKYAIPHTKSGPLNIAKATYGLNEQWAYQRDDKECADILVQYARLIEKSSSDELLIFAKMVLSEFLKKARELRQYNVEINTDLWTGHILTVIIQLIKYALANGQTPQFLCGYALSIYLSCLRSPLKVEGYKDSVFATNTTSKKPGDIYVCDGNKIETVYEITFKNFDNIRIEESHESVEKFNHDNGTSINRIIVLCREEDVPDTSIKVQNGLMLSKQYKSLRYDFFNVFDWLTFMILNMSDESRKEFYIGVNNYVSDTNTSVSVKSFWKRIHSNKDLT